MPRTSNQVYLRLSQYDKYDFKGGAMMSRYRDIQRRTYSEREA